MVKNYIAENISYLHSKETHLTQDEFGALFDLKRGLITGYVNGKATPKIETLVKICDHYKITLDDLVRVSLLEKSYTRPGKKSPDSFGEPPEGYGYISLKYVELLERSVEDQGKLIKALETQIGGDKTKTA